MQKKAFYILQNNNSVIFSPDIPSEKCEVNGTTVLHFLSGGTGGKSEYVTHNGVTLGAAVDGLIQKLVTTPLVVSVVYLYGMWGVDAVGESLENGRKNSVLRF